MASMTAIRPDAEDDEAWKSQIKMPAPDERYKTEDAREQRPRFAEKWFSRRMPVLTGFIQITKCTLCAST